MTVQKKLYVQVGAGAGDLDPRADFRDGFTEFVKRLDPNTIENIVLVEPNFANVAKLGQCWVQYPQAAVFQIGLVPDNVEGTSLDFYWAPEDGPHFQVFSCVPEHVLKHYPDTDLQKTTVPVMKISEFIRNIVGNREIEFLALDIEGMDAEILLNADFTKLNVNNISFELLHLGDQLTPVVHHLIACGYHHTGKGFDVNGWDALFSKNPSTVL